MKAIILSGGTGSRLRPLTFTTAKQLIPVANKPILFYIIEKIAKTGIKDIGIIVGDTGKEIMSIVGDGKRWDVNITYIFQGTPLGLAHAVKIAHPFIGNEDFLMILGDNLFNMDLDVLIDNFYSNSSNSSIMLHEVEDPSQYGVAVIENNNIVKLVEKPKNRISNYIITGVYIFDKNIFAAIDEIVPSKRGELEITDAIQKMVDTGWKVTYELVKGWWKDTGKLCDMLEANQYILNDMVKDTVSDLDASGTPTGKSFISSSATVKNCVLYGPVIIGDNAVVTDSFLGPYTSIDKNAKIHKCKIEDSIILEGSELINIDTKISKSLIGKNARVSGASIGTPSLGFLLGDNSLVSIES